ncbi:transcriptional regulator [Streptomyces griseoviridis]|uniref:transcriptional regulator n=1 Tax=Streptomyces griseoviridis TaxID=45398 RepID=UPI001F0C0247|nr:transcriptional regulator [Streptomyces griseoviridis]
MAGEWEEVVAVEPEESAAVSPGAVGAKQLSLPEKLNHLFETVKNPATGKRYTNAEAARAIREDAEGGGVTVSESALSQLRSGVKPNPTVRTVEAIARLFHVAPSYFFPDFDDAEAERVRASVELLAAVGDTGVRGLALRANGLSADSLKMITDVINGARRLEGLD